MPGMREIPAMRIACPSCQAEYDVPDTLLAGRNAVRCARCGEEWKPAAAAPHDAAAEPEAALPATVAPAELIPEPAPEAALAPEEQAAPALFVPPREPRLASAPAPRAGRAVLVGWLVTILVLAGLVYGGYAWRDRLMSAWPPSTRLYAALGLAHH
jgi:predicted Zn finger-like uncharacterized protein